MRLDKKEETEVKVDENNEKCEYKKRLKMNMRIIWKGENKDDNN